MSICEVYDKEVMGRSQITRQGEGGRIGRERKKTTPERRRMKAVGGGKMEPVEYKPRKDIGQQRQASTRVQQPTQERGSADVKAKAAAAAKEERRKAALARIAARQGKKHESETAKPKAKEVEKTATRLLSTKKAKSEPAPGYTAPKASGLSRKERIAVTKKGQAKLRDLVIQSEREKGKNIKTEKDLKHKYTSS